MNFTQMNINKQNPQTKQKVQNPQTKQKYAKPKKTK